MPNDAKLGLFAGILVMLVVAVFFGPKSIVGTAFINNNEPSTAQSQAPTKPPAATTTFPDVSTHTIWKAEPPRDVQPVSRDPLLWP